jgi:hypothetical protein
VIQEGKISLNHIFGDMWAENRDVGVGSETPQELESKVIGWKEGVDIAIAEHVDSNTILKDVCFRIITKMLQNDLVRTREEKGLYMLNFCCTKKKPVLTK